ncbi:Serine threonine-kinase CTR1 isoform B [Micractinium conductrix]|uniref:non-specific serine/threonine protein kinase n=1 Tax=Micractinium conductrix TaxID=554055 RepID=A0A2P6UZC8_9CHLO|nr:Serine threonine-kinase CTR1 isoform B [Micractinium conductrix]|eukprot:PSC67189.1 Serine threonine-kinase CTR1 isoform B [Micractinium conductrix]
MHAAVLAVLAACLLLSGAAAAPAAAAAAPPLPPGDEGAVMSSLRALLQRSFPGLMACLPGWQPGNTTHHCAWHNVGLLLEAHVRSDAPPLPDIPAGALPSLARLEVYCPGMRSTVPRGWGGSPRTLPALQHLSLRLGLQGSLPAGWSLGFRRLRSLTLIALEQPAEATRALPAAPGRGGAGALPAAWASGFLMLRALHMNGLGLSGPLPPAWLEGGSFPSLAVLDLGDNALSGTLPPRLFAALPKLERLRLPFNRITGSLPGEWAGSRVFELEPGIDGARVWQEVALMRRCSHPRIVPVVGVTIEGPLLLLAMERMRGGNLAQALAHPSSRQRLRWADRGRQVALDVAEGLDHLHSELGILHSDLKPHNVLLSTDWRASIADLGVSQVVGGDTHKPLGFNRVYAAPEQLMGLHCGLSADIYSLGLVLVALFSEQPLRQRGDWRSPCAAEGCPQQTSAMATDPSSNPTLNLNEVEAQELHEHRYAAGTEVAGGAAAEEPSGLSKVKEGVKEALGLRQPKD